MSHDSKFPIFSFFAIFYFFRKESFLPYNFDSLHPPPPLIHLRLFSPPPLHLSFCAASHISNEHLQKRKTDKTKNHIFAPAFISLNIFIFALSLQKTRAPLHPQKKKNKKRGFTSILILFIYQEVYYLY